MKVDNDLAGTWKMSDTEVKEFTNRLRDGWKKWKIPTIIPK